MKVLRWESVGGASGDMILGALLDLGMDAVALERELKKLHAGDFSCAWNRWCAMACAERCAGWTFRLSHTTTIITITGTAIPTHAPHRGLREIEALIQGSTLPEAVKADSLQVFRASARWRPACTGPRSSTFIFTKSARWIPSWISWGAAWPDIGWAWRR
jgi:uncharacterized protein (DUF111 family)